jgi:PPK2 family polyphosphate:nucleotide phosphotransferase
MIEDGSTIVCSRVSAHDESMDFSPPIRSPYLVPFTGSFRLRQYDTDAPGARLSDEEHEQKLQAWVERLDHQQRLLFAHRRYAVLLVFQAMDAAGKDSTIRAVLRGVNPAGCHVQQFNVPSSEELAHDFLWRAHSALPQRGMIGVFNRSHYEEVLAVRVNPELLEKQLLPESCVTKKIWDHRLDSIRDAEQHWARNGLLILKFFLHLSRGEQKKRFLKRIDDPESQWKFAPGDLKDRAKWDEYMKAYQKALAATSRPWAPWYVIPADDKPFMRRTVAELTVRALEQLPLSFPAPSRAERAELKKIRVKLV